MPLFISALADMSTLLTFDITAFPSFKSFIVVAFNDLKVAATAAGGNVAGMFHSAGRNMNRAADVISPISDDTQETA